MRTAGRKERRTICCEVLYDGVVVSGIDDNTDVRSTGVAHKFREELRRWRAYDSKGQIKLRPEKSRILTRVTESIGSVS
jgi:hypothetical protein